MNWDWSLAETTSVNITHHFLSPGLIFTAWQMMSPISGGAGDMSGPQARAIKGMSPLTPNSLQACEHHSLHSILFLCYLFILGVSKQTFTYFPAGWTSVNDPKQNVTPPLHTTHKRKFWYGTVLHSACACQHAVRILNFHRLERSRHASQAINSCPHTWAHPLPGLLQASMTHQHLYIYSGC